MARQVLAFDSGMTIPQWMRALALLLDHLPSFQLALIKANFTLDPPQVVVNGPGTLPANQKLHLRVRDDARPEA